MARSKTIVSEVKPKNIKVKSNVIDDVNPATSLVSIVTNMVSTNDDSASELTNVIVEPVKGKRGRKSKKELMAALGVVSPEILTANINGISNKNVNKIGIGNMSLTVTELTDIKENTDQMSNIVIISNPNLEEEPHIEEDDDQDDDKNAVTCLDQCKRELQVVQETDYCCCC
jgi:hypothetical protein